MTHTVQQEVSSACKDTTLPLSTNTHNHILYHKQKQDWVSLVWSQSNLATTTLSVSAPFSNLYWRIHLSLRDSQAYLSGMPKMPPILKKHSLLHTKIKFVVWFIARSRDVPHSCPVNLWNQSKVFKETFKDLLCAKTIDRKNLSSLKSSEDIFRNDVNIYELRGMRYSHI